MSLGGQFTVSPDTLTAPVRVLLTVAGDELKKDGGNEANRVLRADRTEQPKGWAPNLGIRCAVFFNSQLCQEKDHATRIPFRFPLPFATQ